MNNKVYSLSGVGVDSNGVKHEVTVVGLYNKKSVIHHDVLNGEFDADGKVITAAIVTNEKLRVRTLSIGFSICHPSDKFDESFGVALAKSRAKRKPVGVVESKNITMLNEDACMALVKTELDYITSHIEHYIQQESK